MGVYWYNFHYLGHTVTYRIVARNKHVANRLARQQERAWRLAVDLRIKEQASWS
jgi:hypothetical protein